MSRFQVSGENRQRFEVEVDAEDESAAISAVEAGSFNLERYWTTAEDIIIDDVVELDDE